MNVFFNLIFNYWVYYMLGIRSGFWYDVKLDIILVFMSF